MASQEPRDGRVLRLLRGLGLTVAIGGAAGSVALMIRAGERTPLFLLVLFIFWVLAPFGALLWANATSTHWSAATRATLFGVTLVVALGSLAIYGDLIDIRPSGAANAFPFVIVPPAAILLMAIVLPTVAVAARPRSGRGGAA